MTLVIAEKPSVARDIARILGANKKRDGYLEGDGYQVTWCVGHLVQLAPPEVYGEEYQKWRLETLPILPTLFKKTVPNSTKKQFMLIQQLIGANEQIICATDAGREGQLIFEYVFRLADNHQQKQVKRLWISSMTDEAIKDGFANLKDNRVFESLYQSARCRSEADWLVGMNFTRLFTVKYGTKLTVGRVQTPTLSLIVERHKAITQFIPTAYWQLEGLFGQIKTLWSRGDTNRLDSYDEALQIQQQLEGATGVVSKLDTQRKSEERPLLFDLTELQREANRRFGYTAQETLSTAQSLYETHKLLTYPRTDSRYLSQDMKSSLIPLLNKMHGIFPEGQPIIDQICQQGANIDKRVINNGKVTDHHAIIVTNGIDRYQPSRLTQRENNILRLVMTRMLMTFSKKKTFDETKLEIAIGDHIFKASGRKIVDEGWALVERTLLGKPLQDDEAAKDEEQMLGSIALHDQVPLDKLNILEKKTTAPKPYTEATLLTAMEKVSRDIDDKVLKESIKDKGLGTPATRAGIIERLIEVGYIERQKKNLVPTEQGISFIDLVPADIKQVELTAQWERRLQDIYDGEDDPAQFIRDIKHFVTEVVKNERDSDAQEVIYRGGKLTPIIGKCPRCGRHVFESEKSFYCDGFRAEPKCSFSLWKDNKYFQSRGLTITAAMAHSLLKHGRVQVNGLRSKSGNLYNAIFYMTMGEQYPVFHMEFAPKETTVPASEQSGAE